MFGEQNFSLVSGLNEINDPVHCPNASFEGEDAAGRSMGSGSGFRRTEAKVKVKGTPSPKNLCLAHL